MKQKISNGYTLFITLCFGLSTLLIIEAYKLNHPKTGVVVDLYMDSTFRCIYVLQTDTGLVKHPDTCCLYGYQDTVRLDHK